MTAYMDVLHEILAVLRTVQRDWSATAELSEDGRVITLMAWWKDEHGPHSLHQAFTVRSLTRSKLGVRHRVTGILLKHGVGVPK